MSNLLTRIEPHCRTSTLEPGLAASVFDPAWLLARQWVLGEFEGDDGGTPVSAAVDIDSHAVTVAMIAGNSLAADAATTPIDAIAERSRVRTRVGWTVRERCAVGRELVRQLREHGLDELVADLVRNYAIAAPTADLSIRDPEGTRLLETVAGRLPDGEKIFQEAGQAGGSLAALPGSQALNDSLDAWRTWVGSTVDEPGLNNPATAWIPDRLEHAFSLSSRSRQDILVAAAHRGDNLDWFSFDATAGGTPTGAPVRTHVERAPTPLKFRGMPNARYWELEDASIDLGSVDAAPSDLARLALLEFAFVFGNDMFTLPLQLPFGSLIDVVSLTVSDTFGATTVIPPALRAPNNPAGAWSFLATTTDQNGRSGSLLLPHVAVHALRGWPIEEIRLFRDEMANLVWAREATVEGGAGRPLSRAEEEGRLAPEAPPPPNVSALEYRLQSLAPPSWFPLVLRPGTPRFLELRTLAPSTEAPRGLVLPAIGGVIHEEEVPREGVEVYREFVYARWSDGSTRVWSRNRRVVGHGEGSSGLRFDYIETSEQA
jgi:hypothetical protein